jgi:hypothetical protein
MTRKDSSAHFAALQELEAALDEHRRTRAGADARADESRPARRRLGLRLPAWRLPGWRRSLRLWLVFDRKHPAVRRVAIGVAAVAVLFAIGGGALWWRLASGPIMLDLATPWLTSAIEQNLGNRYRVEVGGTQLERDAQGHTAVRLRDIVLRDAGGATVAVAPKAEVGLFGTSILFASPRAKSIRLVDANMQIRIDTDGRVSVLVGGERPIATFAPVNETQSTQPQASPPPRTARAAASAARPAPNSPSELSWRALTERSVASNLAALLAWLDRLDGLALGSGDASQGGFDGAALTEIGILNGSLAIDDRRNGYQSKLEQISLRLSRPRNGGASLRVVSESEERPWAFGVSLTPGLQGSRRLQLEARKIVLDDLLALRMSETRLRSDTQVSASIASDIAPDGTPQSIVGTVFAQGGSIGDPDDPVSAIPITSAEVGLDWDIRRRTLRMPFKVTAGAARFTLRSEFAAPAAPGGNWKFALGGGWIVLDPLTPDDEGLVLKRVIVRGSIDPARQQVSFEHGDIGTKELGGASDEGITVALSGQFNYGDEPRLAIGLAGNKMSAAAFKRLWPPFVTPKVRDWVVQHIVSGNVERVEIATNATVAAMTPSGPPLPDEGLSVEIVGTSATLRPVAGLPPIRDADVNVRVTGGTARVTLGKGIVDVSPGRRLSVSNGVFEVPDTRPKEPQARVVFRVEGPVPAAAELLALERLRDFSGAPFDPAKTRGAVNAQVRLAMALRPDLPKGSTEYDIAVDLTNFSADKMLFGQKVEAPLLRVAANNKGYEIGGEVKVAGASAQIEYRKDAGDPEARVQVQATLDDAARARLGLDLGNMLSGALPMKLSGRMTGEERDGRYTIETDFTAMKIDNLLPGWVKPPGRKARAVVTMVKEKDGVRFDDLLVDGQGVLAKGSVQLDGKGELLAANFPVYATSDGDKASMKVDRGADGALRVVMRGDVYDGRNFIKAAMAGPPDPKVKARHPDLDLDIELGVVAGHYGETIRGLDVRMSRRGGRVRTFSLNAKIGRDTPLIGDLRTRTTNGRPVVYIETNDAGALFRFTDIYQRMVGGKMWIGMDPPTQDASPQQGIVNVRDFAIRGEGALDRVVSNAQNNAPQGNTIDFNLARAEITRVPGRMSIRDGVLRGPMIGATVEGNIDYARDKVSVRGTLVPLYGLNNMFGQIPIVGLFLGGGSNEGIFGITYEVRGSTSNPQPIVNPISAIAPGVLRKFFEFPAAGTERSFTDPTRPIQ